MKTTSKARAKGFRSGLEDKVAAQIADAGLPVSYEEFKLPYVKPASRHTYKPDFVLPNGIVIETKGMFELADRQKHDLIQAQYPALDLRFVFTNPNSRIRKGSPTTYAIWCQKNGYQYAAKLIPQEWLDEPADPARVAAAQAALGWQPPF